MPVKNARSNVQCDRAFYSRMDTLTVIKCNKEYRLVCAHAKYCADCGHYVLKNSAMMCPYNRKGNYEGYVKENKRTNKCCGRS